MLLTGKKETCRNAFLNCANQTLNSGRFPAKFSRDVEVTNQQHLNNSDKDKPLSGSNLVGKQTSPQMAAGSRGGMNGSMLTCLALKSPHFQINPRYYPTIKLAMLDLA